jgi:hypothetical protein
MRLLILPTLVGVAAAGSSSLQGTSASVAAIRGALLVLARASVQALDSFLANGRRRSDIKPIAEMAN